MKILIVDDHPIVRAGLRRLLGAEPGAKVAEAASGKAALSAFRVERSDLVILDLNLPDVGGLEIIARLKIIDPEARILVLSMHDDRIHVTRALQAGRLVYDGPPTGLKRDKLIEIYGPEIEDAHWEGSIR